MQDSVAGKQRNRRLPAQIKVFITLTVDFDDDSAELSHQGCDNIGHAVEILQDFLDNLEDDEYDNEVSLTH